jgi:hypothetical protein
MALNTDVRAYYSYSFGIVAHDLKDGQAKGSVA